MAFIRGKFACVAGGVSGLGFELSKALITDGLKGLLIADVNEKDASKAINDLKSYGETEIKFAKVDLANMYQTECMLKTMVDKFKHVDILINSAGIVAESNYEHAVQVNYVSLLYATMLSLYKYMPKYKSGTEGVVVNIASTFGIQPGYSLPVYTATKHAVVGIGRAFGNNYYYNRYKVRILTMCPGYTPTSLTTAHDVDFDVNLFQKEIKNYLSQNGTSYGNCLKEMLANPQNGAVWVTEGTEIYQYPIENTFIRS
ncbi:hypothetical protein Trydic_g1423 [Trypoxylus dichotomus]